jgi:hypothetical protein
MLNLDTISDNYCIYTLCHVGPKKLGGESFDEDVIFGNLMHLNYNQVTKLRNQFVNYPKPLIKIYVYKMTNSSV